MPTIRGKNIDVLFDSERLHERCQTMAGDVAREMGHAAANETSDEAPLVIAILKGSFIFAADLIRAMHGAGLSPDVEFITLSSYGEGTVSRGVRVVKDVDSDVRGRDVILVDDILESGRTLDFAATLMRERGARSVRIVVLLDKPGHRKASINADHVGFECPDLFVVGYGMDAAYAYRELPFVGVVRE